MSRINLETCIAALYFAVAKKRKVSNAIKIALGSLQVSKEIQIYFSKLVELTEDNVRENAARGRRDYATSSVREGRPSEEMAEELSYHYLRHFLFRDFYLETFKRWATALPELKTSKGMWVKPSRASYPLIAK